MAFGGIQGMIMSQSYSDMLALGFKHIDIDESGVVHFERPDGSTGEYRLSKGPKGDKGECGVWTGSEPPENPEEYPVWIRKNANGDNSILARLDQLEKNKASYDDSEIKESISQLSEEIADLGDIIAFDVFPTDDKLSEMLVSKAVYFKTKGFYTISDGYGTTYIATRTYTTNCFVKKFNDITWYIQPLSNSNNGEVFLPYFGIRQGGSVNAESNSECLSKISFSFGSLLTLPSGHYYFNSTINLASKQLSLRGASSSFTPDMNTQGLTWLHFNSLVNDDTAIEIATGSLSNCIISGERNTCSYNLDRTKTYINSNDIVSSIEEVKAYAIKSSGGNVLLNNVSVMFFYYGVSIAGSNSVITNVNFRQCRYGLTIGNDVKCKGVFGWNVGTLLTIKGSIVSVTQIRGDSIGEHLVEVESGSSVSLIDLDADYCLKSIIHIGKDGRYSNINGTSIINVHGRANVLHCYDTTTDDEPKSSDITLGNYSEYGLISVAPTATIDGMYVVANALGKGNPLDVKSNYFTPDIILSCADRNRVKNSIIDVCFAKDMKYTEEWIKSKINSFSTYDNSVQLKIRHYLGNVKYEKSNSAINVTLD